MSLADEVYKEVIKRIPTAIRKFGADALGSAILRASRKDTTDIEKIADEVIKSLKPKTNEENTSTLTDDEEKRILSKLLKVFNSVSSPEQLKSAKKYHSLALKKLSAKSLDEFHRERGEIGDLALKVSSAISNKEKKYTPVDEGQIYSTGGGCGQSYRKFTPKVDKTGISQESAIMKGLVDEGDVVPFKRRDWEALPEQVRQLSAEWYWAHEVEDGPEMESIAAQLFTKGFLIDYDYDGENIELAHKKSNRRFLLPLQDADNFTGWAQGTEPRYDDLNEDLRKWFKEKWVRFGPDGKIRGACARGSDSEGKPKCLPQKKAHALGKKGRKYAAAKKRREDPNPERRGKAKNVATKKKSNEGVAEGNLKEFAPYSSRDDDGDSRDIDPLREKIYSLLMKKLANVKGNPQDIAMAAMEVADDIASESEFVDFTKLPKWVEMVLNKVQGMAEGEVVRFPGKSRDNSPLGTVARALGGKIDAEDSPKYEFDIEVKRIPQGWAIFRAGVKQDVYDDPDRAHEAAKEIEDVIRDEEEQLNELKCWPGYTRVKGVPAGAPGSCKKKKTTSESAKLKEEYSWVIQHKDTKKVIGTFKNEKDAVDQFNSILPEKRKKYVVKNVPRKHEQLTNENKQRKCPSCGGELVSEEMLNEKKDACYYKVKSRYKVWPSAYASGALVKCRKVGAKNWGKSTTKENKGLPMPGTYEQEYNMFKKKDPERITAMTNEATDDPNFDAMFQSITEQEMMQEKWSEKYKRSINCNNPKGFSQRAHCQGRKKKAKK